MKDEVIAVRLHFILHPSGLHPLPSVLLAVAVWRFGHKCHSVARACALGVCAKESEKMREESARRLARALRSVSGDG